MRCDPVEEVVGALTTGLDGLHNLDLSSLNGKEAMLLARSVERLGRRMDAAVDRVAGHLDETGKFGVDGHKTAKAGIAYVGRLSGAEAFGRVRTARSWKQLPAVADAYMRGDVPTEMMRAIARFASTPGCSPSSTSCWTSSSPNRPPPTTTKASPAGSPTSKTPPTPTAPPMATTGRMTTATPSSPTTTSAAPPSCAPTAGPPTAPPSPRPSRRSKPPNGKPTAKRPSPATGPTPPRTSSPRSPGQRRMDAILAIFRMARATPAGAQAPEPLVNVIIDAQTLEEELARIASGQPTPPDDQRLDEMAEGRVCQTLSGRRLHPSDVVAAMIVGYVRRVVVDSASNVIDLGRRRRLFTGSSKEALRIQAALRRGVAGCFWADCQSPPHRQQCDHTDPYGPGGRTDVDNGDLACGFHNRLKETGFRPVRRPDGGYDLRRPDGTRITPPT